jgi:hypothetical protein
MGTPRKASDEKEKKASTSKVWVGLTPPTSLNAARSKTNSRNNASHRPGKSHVKIHNQKFDFSKTQAKVISWRKTQTQGGGDKMKARYDRLAEKVTKCGSISQPTLK